MHCADLDRYLEAHLDGRLARTRAALLRRHLSVCASCRRRVLALDALARELNERVHHAQGETIWSELLTPDVQRATLGPAATAVLPPPLPARAATPARGAPPALPVTPPRSVEPQPASPGALVRRLLVRTAGVVALAAALGAVFEFVAGGRLLEPADRSLPAVPPEAGAVPNGALGIETANRELLASWFEAVFGETVPVPATPEGYELLGGRRELLAGAPVAVLIYRRSPDLLTLYVARATGEPPPALLTPASWSGDNWRFGVTGNWQQRDIEVFRAATGAAAAKVATIAR